MNLFARVSLLCLALPLFSACQGGGDGDPATPATAVKTGVFVDAPVAGLDYRTATLSGLTNTLGQYQYRDAEPLTLSIGSLVVGTVSGRPLATPFDLVPGGDITTPVSQNPPGVTNIARLLSTLDEDGDLRNGIRIPARARELASGVVLNFNQSIADFAANGGPAHQFITRAAPASANGQFLPVNAVQAALQETANQILSREPSGAANRLPEANAGTAISVDEGDAVVLTGNGSDTDGQIIAYEWTQTRGTPVTLEGANQRVLRFSAPEVNESQVLRFSLVVVDNNMGRSQPSAVEVTVRDRGGNRVPTVNAGPDQTVAANAPVTLPGSASDPDGSIARLQWTQLSGPEVTLTDADKATARFVAPARNVETALVFRLVATDNGGAIGSDEVTVTVTPSSTPVNQPPQAFAGQDQTVKEGDTVSLTGSGTDTDGMVAGLAWTQTAGPAVTLTGANTAQAGFVAPEVTEITRLDFDLVATDNQGATGADSVTVFVQDRTEALPAVSIAPASAAESDGLLTFTLTLSKPSTQPVVVSFQTANGTAMAGQDYIAKGGSVTFPAQSTSQTLGVDLIQDGNLEQDETFTVTLSAPVNATIQTATATGTIRDSFAGGLPSLALAAEVKGCDPLDSAACLFPFPSNFYTTPAANSATIKTGRRVNFNPLAMPRNIAGKPIDPTEWNRNDGFSQGPMIMTVVPGLSTLDALKLSYGLTADVPNNRVGIANPELSLLAGSPIQVLEVGGTATAPTATPQLVWAELDVQAQRFLDLRDPEPIGVTDPLVEQLPSEQRVIARPQTPLGIKTALVIRPAKNLTPGKRYVVVLRKLRNAANQAIASGPAFAACKGTAATGLPAIDRRCTQLRSDVFPVLQAAGIPVDRDLFLAWDFTVASTENTTGRLVHMRNEAFSTLKKSTAQAQDCTGHDDLNCSAPQFAVDAVTTEGDIRRIQGTLTVPSFVVPSDPSPADAPEFRDALVAISSLVSMFPGLGDVLGELLPILQSGNVPPNRLHYDPTDGGIPMDLALAPYGDGLPNRLPQNGKLTTRFDCRVPAAAFEGASPAYRPSLYGHGLLGGRSEVGAGNVQNFARDYRMLFCAIDWFGFATGDIPNVASVLVDASNFPVIPDASQQGFVNWMFLARLLQHAQGFAASPAFQKSDGTPVFDRREVFYDGNSQGGILPGPLLAVSKDLNRGTFGVPGMNYSTLLRRSVDFTPYSTPLYLSYQNELDRDLVFGLMQMLWDRSENNGYARYLTTKGELDGQDNRVLLHPAYGDHQVSMWTADVMARTMNASVDLQRLGDPVRHPDLKPYFNMPRVQYQSFRASGSAEVVWLQPGVIDPPIDETPPEAGSDPHGYPRAQRDSHCQKSHFLRSDGFVADTLGITDAASCEARFGTVTTASQTGQPATDVQGYGQGLTAASARFFAGLHGVVAALAANDVAGAQSALSRAVTGLSGDFQSALSADPSLAGLVGVNPATYAQDEIKVERSLQPVVLSGAQLAQWSVPAAQGVPYPYPSGATISGQVNDALGVVPGQVQNAHNGVIIYPVPGTPDALMGTDVSRIAAYRWTGSGFAEIPVQVDQRYPYFLANAGSDFSVYSGTDEELTYQWDLERWDNSLPDDPVARYASARPDPVRGLDHDDEVVFMYQDAGTAMASPAATPSTDPDYDPAGGLQTVLLHDPLNPAATRYVYLGLKRAGRLPKFHGQSHYVHYLRDADADRWIDRFAYCDSDPEKLGTSNTGYGQNRSGKVSVTAACDDAGGSDVRRRSGGVPNGQVRDSTDRFPRDGLQVFTNTYRWRASGRWMVREINITRPGQSAIYGPDLIDRWKGRAFQQSPDSTVSLVGFEDEQVNWEGNSSLLGERCGPVRCIREVWGADSGTNVTKTETFYRDAIAYRYRVRVHPIPPDGLYTSWDYNRSAMVPTSQEQTSGVRAGRYYTLLRPQGVPVDGVNDDVGQIDGIAPLATPDGLQCLTSDGLRTPDANGRCPFFLDAADPSFNLPLAFQNWEQISGKGNLGSLVYIFELTGATSLANPLVVPYYRDDACLDDGTGDDPVVRPFPGESYGWNGGAVAAAYNQQAGRTLDHSGRVLADCIRRQGAHGAHGVHYFATHDSDNAFILGKPINEIDGQQWQIMVPTAQPTNLGARYANMVRVPLVTVVVPRPGTP